jgi:hypothetical protein
MNEVTESKVERDRLSNYAIHQHSTIENLTSFAVHTGLVTFKYSLNYFSLTA